MYKMAGIIRLDGVPIEIIRPDLDGDGRIDTHAERLPIRSNNTTQIVQGTELGESLKELNDDSIQDDSRMSSVDFKARLHYLELPSILAMDTLVAFRVLPPECLSFTRQKKRLSISLAGKGREEMVSMVHGKKEMDKQMMNSGGGMMNQMKSIVGMQPKG
jgi:hypothetical protein